MISDALLSSIASLAESAMTASATIYRKTHVADTTGGFSDTYASVGTVACMFAPHQITPTERETTVTVQAISMWRFQFPLGTDVRNTDRIVTEGRTFEVVSAGTGSIAAAVRVMCQEII